MKRKRRRNLGSTYKRRGRWYIRFMIDGREYRESAKTTDHTVALELLHKRRNEALAGTLGKKRATFADLVALIEADYAANGRRTAVHMRAA